MTTAARTSNARRRRRPRATFTGVVGELLITVGVVILLYVVWQIWIGDLIYRADFNSEAAERSREWSDVAAAPAPEPTIDPEQGTPWYEPEILPQPAESEIFAIMRVPRWGSDYQQSIAGGTTRAGTLDTIGIGHYNDTEMPGEVGNFALAAHRTTFGKPFTDLQNLRIGDAIVIETPVGWYTYRFRTLEYVQPTETDVLSDVPQAPEVSTGERYITMTSCSPRFSLAERIVAYGVFESFLPRSTGETPAALSEEVS